MVKLSSRDRLFLLVGGIFIVIFIVMQFIVFPLIDNRDRLKKGIAARENALTEMKELQARYQDLHNKADSLVEQLGRRSGSFSLFSFLEQNAAKTDIKKNIAYMKPSEISDDGPFKEVYVEMKLQAITLPQLVSFLKLVESPENIVALKRISIQENKQQEATLDVILQVVSLDRNPGSQIGTGS